MKTLNKHFWKAFGVLALILLLTGSSCDNSSQGRKDAADNSKTEQESIAAGMKNIHGERAIPVFPSSVEYDTLWDILKMRAEGTHGTALVTTIDGTLKWWCPTEGGPIPSTYQISAEEAFVDPPDRGGQTDVLVPQGEPTGVYPGPSDGTWVKCLDDNGNEFVKYSEDTVDWTSGVVSGYPADKRAKVDEITYDFDESGED